MVCHEGDPGFVVRELRMEEYPAVRRLWDEAGLPYRPQGRDREDKVAAEAQGGKAVFLVAEADGRVVGVVLGTHDGRKGWINRLAVSPDYRRRGIARNLVDAVEARMAALGLDITSALVESHNQASMDFFKALGYAHDPEIEYVSKRRSPET